MTGFLIIGLVQLAIAIYGTLQTRKHFNWASVFVLAVVYGLAYDNLAVAAGGALEAGSTLRAINLPRYWIHALLTPLMMVAALRALRAFGVGFASRERWHRIIGVAAGGLIGLGAWTDIINLDLRAVTEAGVTRYVNHFEFLPGPPIPAVATIVVVLVFGAILWKATRFAWLFIGALIMFATAPMVDNLLAQNVGEIAFAGALVLTVVRAALVQFEGAS